MLLLWKRGFCKQEAGIGDGDGQADVTAGFSGQLRFSYRGDGVVHGGKRGWFEGVPGREVRVHRSISGCARCGCLSLSRDGNKQDLAGFASCCVEVPFGFGLARFHHVCFGLFSLPGIEEALRWKRW